MTEAEPGALLIAVVALVAGVVRGFSGFGGPAIMLAVLTVGYTPDVLISKVFVVECFASTWLFASVFRSIDWRAVSPILVATVCTMPFGQWLLVSVDPEIMRRATAIIIAVCSLALLSGYRYRRLPGTSYLTALGAVSGLVFGATFIALILVVGVLIAPYAKEQTRNIFIVWAFVAVIAYGVISGVSGTTQLRDFSIALPGALTYLLGAWIGSLGFRASSELLFRNLALALLVCLSVIALLN